MIKSSKLKAQSSKIRGQILLIVVLLLGGSTVAASAIAGYLLLMSIKQSSDITNSAKAIFAADTGIEYDLYCRKIDASYPASSCSYAKPSLTNGASFTVSSTPSTTKSIGGFGDVYRAFQVSF